MLYNNLSSYFREKFGTRLKKICIDGGFTCPNRDGKVGTGGCIYCGERGAGEHIDATLSIKEQIDTALAMASDNDKFIAYFQNFTNTYAKIETLKERYDAALCDRRIVALAIGTRPDCIDEDIARLISSYSDRVFVWVEMGLQTSNDNTAKTINRGYKTEVYTGACEILSRYNIPVVSHMIVGLPGEGKREVLETADYIASLSVWGIKIHSIYVMQATALEGLYNQKLYTPPTLSEYSDAVSDIIARLPKEMVIHRITGDCPKNLLIAPEWNLDKTKIIDEINKALIKKGLRQGIKREQE